LEIVFEKRWENATSNRISLIAVLEKIPVKKEI
jgi:hypothetical protein